MKKILLFTFALTAFFIYTKVEQRQLEHKQAYDAACHGAPLTDIAQRGRAIEDGHRINEQYRCIDKTSYETVQRQEEEWKRAKTERERSEAILAAQTLSQARANFITTITDDSATREEFPTPPPTLFVRSDYLTHDGLSLASFISPDPKNGLKHPAIIWLTGGDSNSLGDFWTQGPSSNDQTASALRHAGVIMMFPTLRGGNHNPGKKEFFYNEVKDVIAAAAHLARQPYVDPQKIYLGGHSTGGTLALLTAEMGAKFKAVFALGPVAEIADYDRFFPQLRLTRQPQELRLRSPLYWLHGITSPTYIIEGTESPNIESLDSLCAQSKNPLVRCTRVKGAGHFDVINQAALKIGASIMKQTGNDELDLPESAFQMN